MIKQPQSIWYPHPFPTDIMWQDRSSLESDKMLHFAQLAMLFCHLLLRQICQRAMKSFGKCSSCNLSSSGWTERATDKVSFAILWLVYLCFFLALQCLGDMGAPQHVKLVAWCSSSLLIHMQCTAWVAWSSFVSTQRDDVGLQYFLVLCQKAVTRSNYKPDWQNQLTQHKITFQTNVFEISLHND